MATATAAATAVYSLLASLCSRANSSFFHLKRYFSFIGSLLELPTHFFASFAILTVFSFRLVAASGVCQPGKRRNFEHDGVDVRVIDDGTAAVAITAAAAAAESITSPGSVFSDSESCSTSFERQPAQRERRRWRLWRRRRREHRSPDSAVIRGHPRQRGQRDAIS